MRCGRHPYEAGVGICAPCLRDRLLALAAAQNEASSLSPPPDPGPEPVAAFPRSVSPYVCRRKSDAAAPPPPRAGGLLFFRTPQVGPAYGGGVFEEGDIGFLRRRRSGRFSVLAALFGSHHRSSERRRRGGSWLAGIVPRVRRRKCGAGGTTASPPSPPRRSFRGVSGRGLSPVWRHGGGEEERESASPAAAESPWLAAPTPLRKTPCRRRLGALGSAGAGVSGFAVCISPLVRPGLGRHLRGRGHPPDAAVSGDLRPSPLHPLTSSASLHHCRSWKLADGGRFR
ncbi:hypothetical protein U9M48_033612 [Paspalum notatum var. saurae]|uniref:Uncharacterized protein n=1 Tax=Paspalum notatum var. saurae TaxID=547442 RepID=A0AAQ3UBT1_PASNO